MKKEKTVQRVCKSCGEPFTIITARKVGCHYVANKGWHAKRYCDCCLPEALYKDHNAYMRYWWHNMRKVEADEQEACSDNSL